MSSLAVAPKSNFNTHLRTWVLIAGLTGLLVAIGAVIGGGALYIFVAIAIIMNVVGYWFSDKIAIKASKAQPVPGGSSSAEVRAMLSELSRASLRYPSRGSTSSRQSSQTPSQPAAIRAHAAVAVTQGLLKHMPDRPGARRDGA